MIEIEHGESAEGDAGLFDEFAVDGDAIHLLKIAIFGMGVSKATGSSCRRNGVQRAIEMRIVVWMMSWRDDMQIEGEIAYRK